MAEWRKSGLPAWQYAERCGLNLRTLEKWAARVKRERGRPPVVEVKVPPPTRAPSLEVVVGGWRVVVPADFDEAALRRLLAVLEGR